MVMVHGDQLSVAAIQLTKPNLISHRISSLLHKFDAERIVVSPRELLDVGCPVARLKLIWSIVCKSKFPDGRTKELYQRWAMYYNRRELNEMRAKDLLREHGTKAYLAAMAAEDEELALQLYLPK